MRTLGRLACCVLAGVLLCRSALADLDGRRIADVLDELRPQGFTFIYNTQIVPSQLRVQGEPQARGGLELAREVLAPHRLVLSPVAPGVYAVVPAPGDSATPPAIATPAPAPAAGESMGEVVVQTSRYTLAADAIPSQTFFTQEQVKSLPRLGDETLRALQRLPGIATNGFSSLGPVRGGEPNETAIVLDGLRLYEPFHLKNFLSPVSLLDSRIIDGIEFYSGGFPAVYGDRMSAIIDAASVRPNASSYYELGLSLFHASALAAVDFADTRGHLLASARRSNVGDLAHYAENDFGEPHYSDAFARADWLFADDLRGSFNVLLSRDSIHAVRSAGAQVSTNRYTNAYAWGTLERDWSERANSRLILSYTDLVNERDGEVNEPGQRTGTTHDERSFHIVGLRLDNELTSGSVAHRFGVEARRLWGAYNYASALRTEEDFPFPGSPATETLRAASPRPDGFETGAYWDARMHLGERWTLQGGMRLDGQTYDGSDDGEQWSPRVSVLYAVSDRTHVRASWGRYYQSQGINELQVEDGIDQFHGAQYADHAIVSFDHSFAGGFDLRLEAFHKNYRRVSPRFENLFDPLTLFPEAEFDRVRVDSERSESQGVEAMLRMRPRGAWSGWVGYTWSRVRDHVDGREVPRSWDQPHSVSLGAMWASGPWTVTLADTYHTGWPTTPLEVVYVQGVPELVTERRNTERFAYYNQLDFRVARTLALPRGALDVFVEVSNVIDRENHCCAEYEVGQAPDGALTATKKMDSWLPLVPSAGVLWRFGRERAGD